MKKLIRLEETRAVRPRLAAWAVAAVVVVAATVAGITAGQGNAAPAIEADKASHLHKKAEFKQPKLKNGVLTIKGTEASDKIGCCPQAGEPGILQVDVGDDGSTTSASSATRSRRSSSRPRRATTLCASTRATAPSPTASQRRSTVETATTGSPEARRRAARRRRQRLHRRERGDDVGNLGAGDDIA